MMRPRLYIKANLEIGVEIILESEQRHYLVNTLRRSIGSQVLLFNGLDQEIEWEATLVETHPKGRLLVERSLDAVRESSLGVTLVAGITKGDSMDWLIQKATELGALSIIPLQTQRTVVHISPDRWPSKLRRWTKIAQEAAEQCQRLQVMKILPPVELPQLKPLLPSGPRYLFWEQESLPLLKTMTNPGPLLTVLTGSEGGLSREEVLYAKDNMGFETLSLGPRILRAETAAMSALCAVQTLWGDMG